jgi:arginyl-tRNA synthetase
MAEEIPSIRALSADLKLLGVEDSDALPSAPSEAQPLFSLMDTYKACISKCLAEISGLSPDTIFSALDRTQNLDKGDLILAVPRLRIKNAKPADLAAEWVAKVSSISVYASSFLNVPCSSQPRI